MVRVMRTLALGALGYGAYRWYKHSRSARRVQPEAELAAPSASPSMDLIG